MLIYLWLKVHTFQQGVAFKLLCSDKKHTNRLQGVLISAQYCHYRLVVGGGGESGMVQWLRVEARDQEIRVRFPSPAVISDLVVVERD